MQSVGEVKSLLTNCTYLEDESLEVLGIKFYASPWQPRFSNSAFNLSRGLELRTVWDKIPSDTDVLITHSPPLGVLDLCRKHTEDGGTIPAGRSGCEDLIHEVVERIRPSLHVFGHVHEGGWWEGGAVINSHLSGYGVVTNGQTVFINASTCNKKYQPENPPLVFTLRK